VSIDLGNNTMDRVERILNFIKVRNLGADSTPYIAPFTVELQASQYAVDAGGNALIAQLPGDVITIDKSVSEEFAGDYEIIPNVRYNRAGTVSFADGGGVVQTDTIDLALKQYLPGAFSDAFDVAQFLTGSSGNSDTVGLIHTQVVGFAGKVLAAGTFIDINNFTLAAIGANDHVSVSPIGNIIGTGWDTVSVTAYVPVAGQFNIVINNPNGAGKVLPLQLFTLRYYPFAP
jgi:hypothetical protein